MPATPTLLAGRYRLGELLGRGGMGQVWLARDETLDRDVAIKEITLPDELIAEDRDVVQRRTLREARAAARLSHPNVVQVYDVLAADGRTWIVMEHVPSRSLQQVIAADGPLPDDRAARIGLDVLTALEAAHRAGVRHRDVKPANVLLGHDGRVVLTDFGTGYSSMAYLKILPVDEIKVDRSFVRDMAVDHSNRVLVESTVDLGHNLGLVVVAEGVEDGPTVAALRDLGCDVAQGYHYAKPLAAADFTAFLAHRRITAGQ